MPNRRSTDGPSPLARQVKNMVRHVEEAYLLATGTELTRDVIAKHFLVSQETVRSWLTGRRRPAPEVVAGLARLARMSPVQSYIDLGWLNEADVSGYLDPLNFPDGPGGAGERPVHGSPSDSYAPETAVHALLHDESMRTRYAVGASTLSSSGTYPVTTDAVAEFTLKAGVEPPEPAEARRKAMLARIVSPPGDGLMRREPAYCAVRLELAAFLTGPLRWSGQYTWQGDPGSSTWRDVAGAWPAHILVQDIVSGRSFPEAPDPWRARSGRPLVVIGGRYSAGLAAALIAEALGWQFVLVHSGTSIGRAGQVAATRRDWANGPAEAWSEASAYMRECDLAQTPWNAVVCVRPQSFTAPDGTADLSALEQLRRCPARVLYARPTEAALDWWTRRQIGLSSEGEYAPTAWAQHDQLRVILRRIEQTLRDRALDTAALDRTDLAVAPAEPPGPLEPHRPELPARIVDDQVRLAWQAVTWLGRTSSRAASMPTKSPHAGTLRRYRDALETDRTPPFTPLEP